MEGASEDKKFDQDEEGHNQADYYGRHVLSKHKRQLQVLGLPPKLATAVC